MSSPATIGTTTGALVRRRGAVILACLGLLALALSLIGPAQVHAADAGTGRLSASVTTTVSDGSADFSGDNYSIRYNCDNGQSGTIHLQGDGVAVTSPEITADVSCSVSLEQWSADRYGYTRNDPGTQTVSIVGGQSTDVSFALTYAPQLGTLWIRKVSDYGPFTPPEPVPVAHVVPSSCGNGATDDSDLLIVDPACTTTAAGTAGPRVTSTDFVATAQTNALTGTVDVAYSCTVPGEDTPRAGTVTVPVNGDYVEAVAHLPEGTECTITEDAASAQRPGYTLATNYSETTVTIDRWDASVTVYNNYTAIDGALQISKTVDGDGAAAAPDSYTIDYTCTDDDGAPTVTGEVTLAAGETETINDIPSGTCTLTERDATAADTTLATTIVANGTTVLGSSRTVTIDNDTTTVASFTNTYTRDRGTFSLTKTTTGVPADVVDDTQFAFTYTCTDGTGGALATRAGSAPVESLTVAVGSRCTIREIVSSAQLAGYDLEAPEEQTVTITAAQSVEVAFTNTYTPAPKPTPSDTATAPAPPTDDAGLAPSGTTSATPAASEPTLARTGVATVLPLALLATTLAGGAFLLHRRRA